MSSFTHKSRARQWLLNTCQGLNIVRQADGTVRKVTVR
jgi:hypothetical protein